MVCGEHYTRFRHPTQFDGKSAVRTLRSLAIKRDVQAKCDQNAAAEALRYTVS
jgi:hypothetical protein